MTSTTSPAPTRPPAPATPAWLPVAAVARHAAAVGLGVRRDPLPRRRLLAGRAVAGAAARRRALPRGGRRCRRGLPRPSRRDLVSIVVIGVLWFGVYNVALNEGERRVDAGTAAMLIQVSPVLIALLAALFLCERFTVYLARRPGAGLRRRRADRAVQLARRQQRRRRRGALPGQRGGLLGQPDPAEAAGGAASRRSTSPGWPAPSARSPACRSPATWSARPPPRPRPRSGGWSTSGCSRRRSRSRRTPSRSPHMTASSLGVTTYLVPPLTIVMGLLFLGEAPPTMAYAGGALALVGVAVARRKPRTVAQEPAEDRLRLPCCGREHRRRRAGRPGGRAAPLLPGPRDVPVDHAHRAPRLRARRRSSPSRPRRWRPTRGSTTASWPRGSSGVWSPGAPTCRSSSWPAWWSPACTARPPSTGGSWSSRRCPPPLALLRRAAQPLSPNHGRHGSTPSTSTR